MAVFVLSLMVTAIIGGLLLLARVITRSQGVEALQTPDKNTAYECGVEGEVHSSSRVPSGFYLTAILFVLFDIEIIFLYPWALAYRDFLATSSGFGYLAAFLIFLILFILGLFWEIRVRALHWR